MSKTIVMLAPHEPTQDPRINWEASFAAKKFDVLLLGTQSKDALETEQRDGYTIRRKRIDQNKWNRCSFLFYTLSLTSKLYMLLWLPLFPLFFTINFTFKVIRKLFKCRSPNYKDFSLIGQLKIDITDLLWYARHIGQITKSFLAELRPLKPDVIHCNDIFSVLTGLIIKKRTNCKVIYDAHEYHASSDLKAGPLQRFMLRRFEAFLVKRVDHVITVNPLLAELLEKDYKLDKVYSVPNATPWEENQKKRVDGELTRIANGRIKFLYQGLFVPGRGVEELLKAWQEIDTSKAVLFLRGPANEHREEYMKKALSKSIYFLDPVSEDDLIEAASEADIGLIPYMPVIISHSHCCPNKLSQYMQAGLMIVSNNLLYIKQILEESQGGVVYNSNTIASVLKTVIEDPSLITKCKINGSNYAKNHFNWQKVFPVLEDLYASNKSTATFLQS